MQQQTIKITGGPLKRIDLDLLAEALVAISEQQEPSRREKFNQAKPDGAAS